MEKGEVNWTKMNELERAIDNLEDNTDDCCKRTLDTQGFGNVAKEGKQVS